MLCLRGAAWVHAGRHAPGSPPQPEHAPLPGRRRDALPRLLRLRPDDVVHLGPVPVTTPVRTALDLARLGGGMNDKLLVDLRNIYPRDEVARHGFRHIAIGTSGE